MNYTKSSKLLHHIVFDNTFLTKALFDMELEFFSNGKAKNYEKKHVFISGLARSGTTSLLQQFYETGGFRSLTYLDMPFVIAPNLWRKFSRSKDKGAPLEQRAHGDGILVNFESPEAFDEVFWKLHVGKDYIKKDFLIPHTASDEVVTLYQKYVDAILKSSDNPEMNRYLSKNNNNILRIPLIFKAFPNVVVITPFRKPLSHAASLLNQHHRFLEINGEDRFSKDYMNWLGHHEFGLNHKPFNFGADLPLYNKDQSENINYWLSIWFNYYQFVLDNYADKLTFISYENLCQFPHRTYELLANITDTDFDLEHLSEYTPPDKKAADVDSELLGKCEALYAKLSDAAINK